MYIKIQVKYIWIPKKYIYVLVMYIICTYSFTDYPAICSQTLLISQNQQLILRRYNERSLSNPHKYPKMPSRCSITKIKRQKNNVNAMMECLLCQKTVFSAYFCNFWALLSLILQTAPKYHLDIHSVHENIYLIHYCIFCVSNCTWSVLGINPKWFSCRPWIHLNGQCRAMTWYGLCG